MSDQSNFEESGVFIRFGFLCHCNLSNRPFIEGIVKCYISQYPLVVVVEMGKRIEWSEFCQFPVLCCRLYSLQFEGNLSMKIF